MEKNMNDAILQTIDKAMAETLFPLPGDIISARYHYGIYIGHGEVIYLPVPSPEKPEPVFTLEFMSYFMGSKPIVVKRETEDSVNKPLPADEIIARAKSMLGKHLGGEIGRRKDFVNWCRYGVTAPDVQASTFETTERLGELLFCLARCWSADKDRCVGSLGLSDIDAKGILTEAQIRHNQEVKENPNAGDPPEIILLRTLFGSYEDHENIDEVIEKTSLVCLKEPNGDGSYTVSTFLVNKEDGSYNRVLMVWQTPAIREDLQKAFGSCNMCILS